MANRILETELVMISEDPRVALLTFQTDQGKFEFGINGSIAHEMIDVLAKFLTGGASDN